MTQRRPHQRHSHSATPTRRIVACSQAACPPAAGALAIVAVGALLGQAPAVIREHHPIGIVALRFEQVRGAEVVGERLESLVGERTDRLDRRPMRVAAGAVLAEDQLEQRGGIVDAPTLRAGRPVCRAQPSAPRWRSGQPRCRAVARGGGGGGADEFLATHASEDGVDADADGLGVAELVCEQDLGQGAAAAFFRVDKGAQDGVRGDRVARLALHRRAVQPVGDVGAEPTEHLPRRLDVRDG
jgi:hypothetical protein